MYLQVSQNIIVHNPTVSIKRDQKIGIPTGPMPDGSPNIALLAKYAEIVGVENERDLNGVTKHILTAADIAQIAEVGFVTKSGLIL